LAFGAVQTDNSSLKLEMCPLDVGIALPCLVGWLLEPIELHSKSEGGSFSSSSSYPWSVLHQCVGNISANEAALEAGNSNLMAETWAALKLIKDISLIR
jgi:hypothetical protein